MKKGELTSAQIIGLVLAIAAFLIVFSLFLVLKSSDYTEKDVCHLSVLTRATAPSSAQAAVPLKCTTQKICLNDGKGQCDEAFAGEKAEQISLPSDQDQAARKIEEVTAAAMYDCWQMMGEGKLDIFHNAYTQFNINPERTTCVVCSRVAVDKQVNPTILEKVNVNEYLRKNQVPGSSLTYLQAFTDRSIQSYASVQEDALLKTNDEVNSFVSVDEKQRFDALPQQNFPEANRQLGIIFMQIKTQSWKDVVTHMTKIGGTVVGTAFVTPTGRSLTKAVLWSPWGRAAVLAVGAGALGYGIYNANQGQLAAIGRCGAFAQSDDKAKEGCSLLQGINYKDYRTINNLCDSYQGAS